MKIVLTGGGTGGHIYPAVSVGQALQEAVPSARLLFVGSSHGPEGEIVGKTGIPFRAVPSSPLTKSPSLKNMASMAKLAMGVFRARGILRNFGPDVVVGTGGYTTAAVLLAAKSLGLPIVIHEQNAVPGKTNKWLSRIATRVCVSLESSAGLFPADKVVVTGLPVRREFRSVPDKKEARRALGLDEDLFTIVVVGGSQGAAGVNKLVLEAWPMIDDGSTQVLHQVGQRNISSVQSIDLPNPGSYHVEAYVDTPTAFAAADLVISRGGGTIAEITAVGVPSVIFPYPYHKDQHQKHNAEFLVSKGAAVMCEELVIDAADLAKVVTDLRSSPDRLAEMAAASKAVGKPDAAERVAEVVLGLVKS